MKNNKIIFVLLVKQSRIKKDCFIRLFWNCYFLKRHKVQNVLIVDSSSMCISSVLLKSIANCFGFDYIFQKNKFDYSPAKIKNIAAEYAINELLAEYLFFVDVDVVLRKKSLDYIYNQANNKIKFDWLPVVFLDKKKSMRNFIKSDCYDKKNIVQIGYTTGIQLIENNFFKFMGGYNEIFEGYGNEDIEFLHRATAYIGIRGKVDQEYYLDKRSLDVTKLQGYRKFFYEQKKDFPRELMPCHFWHKRKNKSSYMLKRKENDILLKNIMKKFDEYNMDRLMIKETGVKIKNIKEYEFEGVRFIYRPGKTKVVISFSAFAPKNTNQNYNYLKDFINTPYSVFCFLGRDKPKSDPRGTYYLDDDLGKSYLDKINRCITANVGNFAKNDIYLIGSSKGGVAALLLGLLYEYRNIYVLAPQYNLARYIEKRSLEILEFMTQGDTKKVYLLEEIMGKAIHNANKDINWNIHFLCGKKDAYHLRELDSFDKMFLENNIKYNKLLINGAHDVEAISEYRAYLFNNI